MSDIDIAELRRQRDILLASLAADTQDVSLRIDAYLSLAQMYRDAGAPQSSIDQILIQVQITSYGGEWGEFATLGNYAAFLAGTTDASGNREYDITLDEFSTRIVLRLIEAAIYEVETGGDGILSVDALQDLDYSVWVDLGMGDLFPGNLQRGETEDGGLTAEDISTIRQFLSDENRTNEGDLWTNQQAFLSYLNPFAETPTDRLLTLIAYYRSILGFQVNIGREPIDYGFGRDVVDSVLDSGTSVQSSDGQYTLSLNEFGMLEISETASGEKITVIDPDAEVLSGMQSVGLAALGGLFTPTGPQGQIPPDAFLTDEDIDRLKNQLGVGLDGKGRRPSGIDAEHDPGPLCFLAGTPILLADGSEKPIEDIVVGDIVTAFDAKGVLQPRRVVRLFRNHTAEFLELSNGLFVTPGHHFLNERSEFESIGEILARGGSIVNVDGASIQVTARHHQAALAVGSASSAAQSGWPTFNFEVEELHTYIAGGVRVHNLSILASIQAGELPVDVGYTDTGEQYLVSVNRDLHRIIRTGTTGDDGNTDVLTRTVVFNSGSAIITTRWTEFDEDGVPIGDGITDVAFPDALVTGADVARIFGSQLGNLLIGENDVAGLGATIVGQIAANIGETFDIYFSDIAEEVKGSTLGDAADLAFDDFGVEVRDAGIGAISSFLTAELFEFLDLEGEAAGLAQSGLSNVVATIGRNLTRLGDPLIQNGNPVKINGELQTYQWDTGLDAAGVGNIFGGAVGSYFGTKLANQILSADTFAGQIGGSIGGSFGGLIAGRLIGQQVGNIVGSFIGSTTGTVAGFASSFIAGAFTFGIGALVGTLLGTFIGDLFGTTPKSGADLDYDPYTGEFKLGASYKKGKGSRETAEALATQVGETLNGVLSAVGGTIANPEDVVPGHYGLRKSTYQYKTERSGRAINFSDAGDLAAFGTFVALENVEIVGGDVYRKRALYASLENQKYASRTSVDGVVVTAFRPAEYDSNDFNDLSVEAILGDLSVAGDFAAYIANTTAINALVAADDDPVFGASWVITLQRAYELGLHRRHEADWYGGFEHFLASEDVAASAVQFVFDGVGGARYIAVTDVETGQFRGIDDTVISSAKDQISGTAGDDMIVVAGTDVDVSASSVGVVVNGEVPTGDVAIDTAAVIRGGDGNDTILGGDRGNDLFGEGGDDSLRGGVTADWLFGGDGADTLDAFVGDDGNYLSGDAGDDRLLGADGSDWLDGGDGNDTLLGGSGGDVLSGGAGVDVIRGGAGNDHFVWNIGDGADDFLEGTGDGAASTALSVRIASIVSGNATFDWSRDAGAIYTTAGDASGGIDVLALGEGISFDHLLFERVAGGNPDYDDLKIIVDLDRDQSTTNEELVLREWFDPLKRVEYLQLADGQRINLGAFETFVVGTSGNDTLFGTSRSDFINGGDGDDSINLLGGDDFGVGGSGADIITGDSGKDIVVGGDGSDRLLGGADDDRVIGGRGDDDIYGGSGNDLLVGDEGDDTLIGGAGNDIFKIARGGGHDTILDALTDNWEAVWTSRDTDGDGAADGYINGYVFDGQTGQVTKDGTVVFDGEKWVGRFEYDWNTETLTRHLANLIDDAEDEGQDRLEFDLGISVTDLVAERRGDDLVIGIGSDASVSSIEDLSDRLTLVDWFRLGAPIEELVFISTGMISLRALGEDLASDSFALGAGALGGAVTGDSGRNLLIGSLGDESLRGLGGDDVLLGQDGDDSLEGGAGDDILIGGSGDDMFRGDAGADRFDGGEGFDVADYGSEQVALNVDLSTGLGTGGSAEGDIYIGIDGVVGGTGADTLLGNTKENELTGGTGADSLSGGRGADLYIFSSGDGSDVIDDQGDAPFVAPAFSFDPASLAGLVLWLDPSDTNSLTGSTTISGFTDLSGSGNDGAAATGSTVTTGSVGLQSGLRVDGDILRLDDAASINLSTSTGRTFALVFETGADVTTRQVIYEQGGGSRGVAIYIEDGILTLSAWNYAEENWGPLDVTAVVEANTAYSSALVFDGSQNSVTGYLDGVPIGTVSDADSHTLYAHGGDAGFGGSPDGTSIKGSSVGAGATFTGGIGEALFYDRALSSGELASLDAYLHNKWVDTSRTPTDPDADGIQLTDIVLKDVGATLTGNDLTLSFSGAADSVLITDFTGAGRIEDLVLADGLSVNLGAFAQSGSTAGDFLVGSVGADTLSGLGGNDTLSGRGGGGLLEGGAGHDLLAPGDTATSVDGGAGLDTIYFGDLTSSLTLDLLSQGGGQYTNIENVTATDFADSVGGDGANNRLEGRDGADTLSGAGGLDTLSGGAGNDLIDGGTGADVLYGDDGADTLRGGAGVDAIYGGAGDDLIETGSGDGSSFDAAFGEDGDDSLIGGGDADSLVGGAGSDTLRGGAGDDILVGDGGDDILDGGAGSDTLVVTSDAAASGQTRIVSASGYDVLELGIANAPADLWFSWSGNDLVVTSLSAPGRSVLIEDWVETGPSGLREDRSSGVRYIAAAGEAISHGAVSQLADRLAAIRPSAPTTLDDLTETELEALTDLYADLWQLRETYADNETLTGGAGADTLVADANLTGSALIIGGAGNDSLVGAGNDDTITGDAGDDTIRGGGGADSLAGGLGADLIEGDAGTDTLVAEGADTLRGGADDDVYIVGAAPSDVEITDVGGAQDSLVLSSVSRLSDVAFERQTPVSFNPSSLSDLVLWFDPSDPASITGGASVTGIADLSGRANAGSADSGAEPSVGSVGLRSGLVFDGNDQLRVGDTSDLNTASTGGRTLSFVLQAGGDVTTRQVVYEEGGVTRGIAVYIEDGVLHMSAWNYAEENWGPLLVSTPIAPSAVHAAVFVFDGAAGEVRGYLDGGLVGSASDPDAHTLYSHGDDIGFGAVAGGTNIDGTDSGPDSFDGGIGESVFYNRALSGTDIALLSNHLVQRWVSGTASSDLSFETRDASIRGRIVSHFENSGAVETVSLADGRSYVLSADDTAVDGVNTILAGTDGTDLLSGGTGSDVVYGNAAADSLTGGGGDDALFGGSGADTLRGGSGDDTLYGGSGGDLLDGGAGFDWVSYEDAHSAVVFDADAAGAGDALNDQLVAIEGVLGSDHDDTLLGSASAADLLDGGLGNDSLDGRAGADTFLDSAGNDFYEGGDGNDMVVFEGDRSAYDINSSTGAVVHLATGEIDILSNVETVRFDDIDVQLGVSPNNAPEVGNDQALPDQATMVGDPYIFSFPAEDQPGAAFIDQDGDALSYSASLADGSALPSWLVFDSIALSFSGTPPQAAVGTNLTIRVQASDGSESVTNDFVLALTPRGVVVTGTSGADDLTSVGVPDSGRDTLNGFGGDDTLEGGGEADIFDGGSGFDLVSFQTASGAVALDLGAGTGTAGDALGDLYTSIEGVIGSSFADTVNGSSIANLLLGGAGADTLFGAGGNDTLDGGSGANSLRGGSGSDVFIGGAGADAIDGEGGSDLVDYGSSNSAMVVDLSTQSVSGGDADNDTIANIESVTTGSGNDVVALSNAANTVDGGAGMDRAVYTGASAGVTVALDGSAGSGGAAGDRLFNIEHLTGSVFGDALTGDDSDNAIEGGDGADSLFGGAGRDTLDGGAGNDWLEGGADSDELWGGAGDDTLMAGTGGDHLYGGAGADSLVGDAGNDTYYLDRSSGHDRIDNYDTTSSTDTVTYGADVDYTDLWFQKAGRDLVVTILGAASSATIENWFDTAGNPDEDYLVDLFFAGERVTRPIATEIMALLPVMEAWEASHGGAIPTDYSELTAAERADIEAAWGNNEAPTITPISNLSNLILDEGSSLTLSFSVADDLTPLDALTVFAERVSGPIASRIDGAPDAGDPSIWSITLSAPAGQSGSAVFNVFVEDGASAQGSLASAVTVDFDEVADTPPAPTAPGVAKVNAGQPRALSITASLGPNPGSETLQIQISGPNTGWVLNKGVNQGGGVWLLSAGDLSGLTITPPANSGSDIALSVRSRSVIASSPDSSDDISPWSSATPIAVPVNGTPTAINITGTTIQESPAGGGNIGTLSTVDPDAGDTFSYAVVGGADAGNFEIVGTTLRLKSGVVLDHENAADRYQEVRVRSTDQNGLSVFRDLTIEVTNRNEKPSQPNAANATIAESNGSLSVALTGSSDPDFANVDIDYAFTLRGTTSGNAGGFFRITQGSGNTATLGLNQALDYEYVRDNAGLSYIKNDGGGYYLEVEFLGTEENVGTSVSRDVADTRVSTPQIAKVYVTDVNETPYNLRRISGSQSVSENAGNGTIIGTYRADDNDRYNASFHTLTYSLANSAGGRFAINSSTGVVTVANAGAINYESATSHVITVRARDINNTGLYTQQNFIVTVGNIDDTAPVQTLAGGISSPIEGGAPGTLVFDVNAQDPDNIGSTFNYSIISGNTGNAFNIDSQGRVTVQGALDFETTSRYDLRVRVQETDSGAINDRTYTVNVVDGDEQIAFGSYSGFGLTAEGSSIGYTTGSQITYHGGGGTRTGGRDGIREIWGWTSIVSGGQLYDVAYSNHNGDTGVTSFTAFFGHFFAGPGNSLYRPGGSSLPIVLDLDGDGIEIAPIGVQNILFDHDSDGEGQRTDWVGADDGLLVLDRNGNGRIDDGGEISFVDDLPGASTDLEGLAAYDTNGDGLFDTADEEFARFQIWRDADQDGVSQEDELAGLEASGIVSIDLALTPTGIELGDLVNAVILNTASFTWSDGSQGEVGDVAFRYSTTEEKDRPTDPSLRDLRMGGMNVRDLRAVLARDDIFERTYESSERPRSLLAATSAAAAIGQDSSLNRMLHAMAAFDEGHSGGEPFRRQSELHSSESTVLAVAL